MNEAEELLRTIEWKRHRGEVKDIKERTVNRDSLAFELADMTKYVLSLWQVWGFDEYLMLESTLKKSRIMDLRLNQEFFPLPPPGARVLVADLDGTLADLRGALVKFVTAKGFAIKSDQITNINADVDFGMDYRLFQQLKDEFIREHGYEHLSPNPVAMEILHEEGRKGTYIIVCTARPADRYPHIWIETDQWLQKRVNIDQLHIGSDVRLDITLKLKGLGYDVILMDDDPDLLERALNSGVNVAIQPYAYNQHLWERQGVVTTPEVVLGRNNGLPFTGPSVRFAGAKNGTVHS